MRNFALLITFFSLSFAIRSQNLDSIIKLVKPGVNDTSQIRLLNNIAYQLMESDPEKGLFYVNEALIRAKKINDKAGIANANNIKGVCYDVIGNYDSALVYYRKALTGPAVKSDKASQAGVYSNIGLVYWNLDNYPEALVNFNKARYLIEQTKNTPFLAHILNNTGLIYHDVKDYPESNAFFKKAIAIYQKGKDTLGGISSVLNLAINYFETKRFSDCEALFRQYAPYVNRLDDYEKSEFLINKATLEINTILKNTTEKDLEESLRLKKQIGHSLGVANVLIQFSEFYNRKGNYQKANSYCYEALSLAKELQSLKKLEQVYDNLFFNYANLNINDSAQKYRKLYTVTQDTMFAEAKARAFSREQVAFKTFEKEKENLKLINENNTIKLNNQLIIVAVVSLFVLVILSYWFYSRIKKQKQIVAQKEMTHRLIFETEQQERERIARDLHDSVGQKLSVVKMKLSMNNTDLHTTGELLDEAITDLRTASHNLMPEDLNKGLVKALEEMVEQINYTQEATKINLDFSEELIQSLLPKQTELYLYRVIQEAISNALKYAQAKNIHINMDVQKGQLKLILSDDGLGFDTATTVGKDGIGLKNMKARIDQLKGTLQVQSKQNEGTGYTIQIPL